MPRIILETLWLWHEIINPSTAKLFNLEFSLTDADAIHNFKWVKIFKFDKNGGKLFSNLADLCHVLSLTGLKSNIQSDD